MSNTEDKAIDNVVTGKPNRGNVLAMIGALSGTAALIMSCVVFFTGPSDSVKKESIASATQSIEVLVSDGITTYFVDKKKHEIDQRLASYNNAEIRLNGTKPIYGNENARFTLVEYSDMECAYCKRYHQTPKEVVDRSNGLVNWEWVHLPLPFHNPAAQVQALASECVLDIGGNRSFWAFLTEVFNESAGNGQGVRDLKVVAESVGVSSAPFSECMRTAKHAGKLQDQLVKAEKMQVNSTPTTFIVDNQTGRFMKVQGAQPAASLEQVIEQLLKTDPTTNQVGKAN